MNINPSYGTGFARNKAESEYPEMWDGLVYAAGMFLGPSGKLMDWSGNGNHGTLTNMDVTDWVGDALNFPGANEHVRISADLITTPGTVSMWINPDTLAGTIDSQPTLVQTGTHYWAVDGNDDALQFYNGGWRNSTGVIVVNKWQHIALVATTSDTKIYLDGDEVYSAGQVINNGAGTIYISGRPDVMTAPYTLDGLIRELLIYDRDLSVSEVRQLFHIQKGLFIPRRRVYGFVAAGSNYFETPSDTISLAEALSKDLDISISDTISLTEALSQDLTVPVSDAMSLAESLSKNLTVLVSESISLADTPTKSLTVSVADTIIITDVPVKSLVVPISEAISLADAPVKTLTVPVSDTITISESTIKAIQKAVSDSITLSDSPALTKQINVADTISLSDSPVLTIQLDATDAITITDSLLKQISIEPSDAVFIAESIIKVVNRIEADGVIISNSVVTSITGVINQIEADIIVLSDSVVTVKITGAALKDRKEPIDRANETIEWQEIIDIERGIE